MSEKLRLLTEKIYEEGIEKARKEAKNIEKIAVEKAEDIVSQANTERSALIEQTKEEMDAYKSKIESEIRMAARKSINKIKQDLTSLLQEKVINKAVKSSLSSEGSLVDLMEIALQTLQKNQQGSWTFAVQDNQEEKIRNYIENEKQNLLSQDVQLVGRDGLEYGFQVKHSDDNYYISFDDRAFSEFFHNYLSIETTKLLKYGD